jgi:hypothetical protein
MKRRRTAVVLFGTGLLLLTAVVGGAWKSAGGNPFTTFALSDADRFSAEGRILERLEAGNYLYFRLEAAGQTAWAVTLAKPLAVGTRVRVTVYGRARPVRSHRLQREFDELWFVTAQPLPEVQPATPMRTPT